ncbi:MAG: tetratricopeptide repeat protein [Alphaproteobacteria bacterium]|nr:tetratricopeptide repeat protein [Alphaproteobacteria bacterium]
MKSTVRTVLAIGAAAITMCLLVRGFAVAQTFGIQNAAAGLEALHRGSYDDAIQLLTKAIDSGNLAPSDLEFAYLNRGKAYLAKGDYADAAADLEKAVALNPNDADAAQSLERALAGNAPHEQTPFRYQNSRYRFALAIPAGWAVHERGDDPSGTVVEFRSPHFTDTERVLCNVTVNDNPATAHYTQNYLNAEVARGEAESVLRNGLVPIDPSAMVSSHPIVKLGGLTVQEGDATFLKLGMRWRAVMLLAFVPGRNYTVICLAPLNLFPEYQVEFDAILESFGVSSG